MPTSKVRCLPDLAFASERAVSMTVSDGSIPTVWATIHRLARSGSPKERRRIKAILGRVSALHPGRPVTELAERTDVQLAKEVDVAMPKLRRGFEIAQRRRRAGGFASGSDQIAIELTSLGYEPHEADALSRARTLESAATRVVAARHRMKPRSVSATVSRGKRLLRGRGFRSVGQVPVNNNL